MKRQPPAEHLDPCEVLIDILLEFIEQDAGEQLPVHVADLIYYYQAPEPLRPTKAVPGSARKLAVMAERYRRRERLQHHLDEGEMGEELILAYHDNSRHYLVERT